MRAYALLLVALLVLAPWAAQAQPVPRPNAPITPVAADVRNDSVPEACAEKDNVALTFSNPAIRRFRVEAVHPAYIGTLQRDRTAPDWTACDMSGDPVVPARPRREVLFTSDHYRLVGFTFPSFWRPADVPVRIGANVFSGLHMVQLFVPQGAGRYEVLVFYPPDGYWRARPLPPFPLRETAYGSSVLLGPVEVQGRPLVRLKEVAFQPDLGAFTLSFAAGGSAQLRITTLDAERQVLDVTLDGTPGDRPFAALRSMYVTAFNNDVSSVAWRAPGAAGWKEGQIMDFPGGQALGLWAGRLTPSRHNTSSPDMVFGPFGANP
ncbi:hypothetical protein J5J86_22800 [Aquabacter sp. L1I39]|uniref:hypothetical protein n=1 Tax=Aquabacter sp. L1I39 TaxID=2820278 RepID=UPI001AD97CF6|nr:hypothetical protein [Aquabacter sp. L1I39]QTL03523.1 hypothetical protein J5J86_22800 [Aquabacter sp. L1I39]